MTKLEILEETIEFYSTDPSRRSLDDAGSCVYNAGTAQHCAVGRCLIPKFQEQGRKLKYNVMGFEDFVDYHGYKEHDDTLQEQYRGHSLSFWGDLQHFHDAKKNWSEVGITPHGEEEAQSLITKYRNK